MPSTVTPPRWHFVASALLAAWNLVGCWFCWLQISQGTDWMPNATAYDRALYASLPGWYNPCYAVGVGAGLLGALALLARRAVAVPLLALSLAAVLIQFGYLFAATDVIRHKGAAVVVPFPCLIALVAALALWGATRARRRGWAG